MTRRLLVCLRVYVLLTMTATVQAQDTDMTRAAATLKDQIFATCGGQVYTKTSRRGFFGAPDESTITQYKTLTMRIDTVEISEADKLNGIQGRSIVTFWAGVWREYPKSMRSDLTLPREAWSKWNDPLKPPFDGPIYQIIFEKKSGQVLRMPHLGELPAAPDCAKIPPG